MVSLLVHMKLLASSRGIKLFGSMQSPGWAGTELVAAAAEEASPAVVSSTVKPSGVTTFMSSESTMALSVFSEHPLEVHHAVSNLGVWKERELSFFLQSNWHGHGHSVTCNA